MQKSRQTDRPAGIMALLTLLAMIGCSDTPTDVRDQRLAEFAQQSVREQAKQNEYIARQSEAVVQESQKLAEASKELVAKDAEARREMVSAQRELTSQFNEQRASIDTGRNELEQERKQIAEQRHRDPIIASSIQTIGLILACLLPLLVCVYVLRQMNQNDPDNAAVAELLVSEVVSEEPKFLPGPALRPAIGHRPGREQAEELQIGDPPNDAQHLR